MMEIKRICVYCASSTQISHSYFEAAYELGQRMARLGIGLVNGAGNMGRMQASAAARQQEMARLSDAAIVLPGGCGTMAELMELVTWKQLGLYLKPIVILNLDGFFDPLLEQLSRAAEENFMRREHLDIWRVAHSPEEALQLALSTPLWDKSVRRFAAI